MAPFDAPGNDNNKLEKPENNPMVLSKDINPKHADLVKRLDFKEGDKLDGPTINNKMTKQFDDISNSVGKYNAEAQGELGKLRRQYMDILDGEGDINKKLEACWELLKWFDDKASQNKWEQAQREKLNTEQSQKDAKLDKKQTSDAFDKIQKILDQVKELQKIETEKRNAEKKRIADIENIGKKSALEQLWPNFENILPSGSEKHTGSKKPTPQAQA